MGGVRGGGAGGRGGGVGGAAEGRALGAVARTRALGLHVWGHLLGIEGERVPDGEGGGGGGGVGGGGVVLRMPAAGAPLPAVAVASLADLALGSAVRARIGAGRRLGTTSLSVQHVDPRPRGPLVARGLAAHVDEAQGHARCEVTDAAGGLVALATGWFFALPVPEGRRLQPLPWERDDARVSAVRPEDLDERERGAVAAAVAAEDRAAAAATAVADELLGLRFEDAGHDRARGELAVGLHVTNRVGHVQGGALYGVAARAAEAAAGDGLVVVDGQLQLLRPADGDVLVAEAEVLRRGRRATFAAARLSVDGRLVAVAQLGLAAVPR